MKKTTPLLIIASVMILALIIIFVGSATSSKELADATVSIEEAKQFQTPSFNTYLLNTLESYERDGTYPYSWVSGYKGVSRDLYYQGTKIANANPDSSHSTYCCGLSYEVYYRTIMHILAEQELKPELNGMKASDFENFISLWFVQETKGDGPGLALEAYGLGKKIDKMHDVEAGDFVQIWRSSGSGHSVIFIEWVINEAGDTTGMTYWSTQPKTNGVNYNTEYFDGYGGKIDPTITHYSRAFMPQNFIQR